MRARHLLFVLFVGSLVAASVQASPGTPVTTSLRLETGNWFPLSESQMTAACADAALSEITSGGWLRIVPSEAERAAGNLDLAISLIGRAETAKLTITLAMDDRPTTVSTASISVRGLDHQGIFQAFEHIGRSSAERLNARIEALGLAGAESRPAAIQPGPPAANDPVLKANFGDAQSAKHSGDYDRARVLFEAVADAKGESAARLAEMARDELRYGLPVFEARKSLLELGRLVNGGPNEFEPAMARAEKLYRQIQAENPHDVGRVQEAQRALDELAVSRGAITNVLRAQAMSHASQVRVMLLEFLYSEGECMPEGPFHSSMGNMPGQLELESTERIGERGIRYLLRDARSGVRVRLACDRDVRIEAS